MLEIVSVFVGVICDYQASDFQFAPVLLLFLIRDRDPITDSDSGARSADDSLRPTQQHVVVQEAAGAAH